jgi:diguanylate cyclase (GGDEF)-like protein
MDRLIQARELVRQTAMLLSGERPLADVLRELAELLAMMFDANMAILYAGANGEPRVYEHGAAPDPDAVTTTIPVIYGGETLGELRLRTPEPMDPADTSLLESCAVYLGARLHDDQSRSREQRLEQMALTDALTTVPNRRAFDETFTREWSRARRNGSSLALLMLDIDHFKRYNDTYGHRAGDQCLNAVATTAAACLRRPGDFFGRYGGEEFVALLPETSLEGALVVAETMRNAVERLAMSHDGTPIGRLTISAGVAQCSPLETGLASELLSFADAALYSAKAEGRNRVVGSHTLTKAEFESRTNVGNLPSRPTRFVGHAEEVARLTSAIERTPVVTVTGPGGVGKTRIALEIARRLGGFFPEGAWFLDLSMLDDGEDLVPFVCEILRPVAPLARDAASLASALGGKRMLLLLDSCEHVIVPAVELVDALTAAAPQLRVLITSREALGARDEVVHRLGSLPLEDAIEMFAERARNVGVWLGDERRAVIAAIVGQLDAIPLAIELAVPQLRKMSPEELLKRLDDRLHILGMENPGGPNRQQTLEALLDWSHRLLDEYGRRLFRRLAIFTGGCTLEAAMHVCVDAEFNEAQLRESLDDLIAKSLVQAESAPSGTRYRQLEVTRVYAQGLLAQAQEFDSAAYSHVHYFTRLAERMEAMLESTPMTQWRHRASLDAQNFRAALSLAIDAGDIENVASICEALQYWLWEYGGVQSTDLTRRIATVLTTTLKPVWEAPLRLALAALVRRSDRIRAHDLARRALDLYRGLGDRLRVADALRCATSLQHDTRGAPDKVLEAEMNRYVDLMLDAGSTLRAAELLNNLGVFYAQTLDNARLHDALGCFERAAALLEARGDSDRVGRVIGNSAGIAFLLGDVDLAVRRSRRAVDLVDRSDESWIGGRQWANHGYYLLVSGAVDEARAALRRGLSAMRDVGDKAGVAGAIEYEAQLFHRTGNDALAARLIGFADAAFGTDVSRQAREAQMMRELIEGVRNKLGHEAYAAETTRGAALSLEQVIVETESG